MDKLWCGIDVSAKQLAVAVQDDSGRIQQRSFENNRSGHGVLLRWLQRSARPIEACLEATGVYSVDVALALHAAGIRVGVLNPKIVCRFSETLGRTKTDPVAAMVLSEYARRMPWHVWVPPSPTAMALRAITRHWATVTKEHTMQRNRLHAAESCAVTPRCVTQDLKRSLRLLEASAERLRREALRLVASDEPLSSRFQLLLTIPGIGETSGLQLLGELMMLPADMDVRQWVAHSGLDPVHHTSGSSVEKRPHISRAGNRHLRRALFMPALVGVYRDPHLGAFYRQLLARDKRKLQALLAVARKLLHAIFGMFRHHQAYDGQRLFPQLAVAVP